MEQKKSSILIGTSGFSYDDWIGPVYPEGIQKGDMLRYYSHELGFKVVELNFTYYTMPSPRVFESMLKETPEDFYFVVKAHSSMTHKIRAEDGSFLRDEGAFEAFLKGVEPLTQAGRLKCALAQFPMKFNRTADAVEHLKWVAESLKSIRLTVEFRNSAWVSQSVFNTLKSLDVGYCVVDEPDLPGLVPFTPVVTASPAYVRYHGRNPKWFNTPINVRYDYLYPESELRGTLGDMARITRSADETLVFFNNHFRGSAVKNAKMMIELLGAGQEAV
ncbi:MAG: DUF72 domain-containing protein [Nitrospinae bacterium]|nr:DUF72 domain-containing protein [Nitrospinota bacterium]